LVNVRGSYVFVDFVVLDTQEEKPLILGRPFLRDVNARIDVGAEKIQFRIGRRNMTFKFQAKEEQCYLVQDEEARGGGCHRPNTRKKRWPQPSPRWIASLQQWGSIRSKTKHSKGATNPRSREQSTRLRGKRRRKSRTPPLKPHRLHRHQRKQRRCARVKRVSSESFTSGPDEPKINWANGGVPLTESKPRALTER
jgi:hypothetical protein